MDFTANLIVVWLENVINFVKKNQKNVIIGFLGVFLVIAGITGYWMYQKHLREQAHKAFIQARTYFDGIVGQPSANMVPDVRAKYFVSDSEKWQKTEQVFRDGYATYKGTELAPMFLVYQSEALLNLGRLDEAIKILDNALKKIKSAPVKDYYQVKLALMMMDSNDAIVKQEGLTALKMVADNTQSIAHELALYHLGFYYWTEKKFAEAKTFWQMLLIKYGTRDTKHPSPFVEMVKEKLGLLSVEQL
jgi:tetratricopeptide (TPR) repeat protein